MTRRYARRPYRNSLNRNTAELMSQESEIIRNMVKAEKLDMKKAAINLEKGKELKDILSEMFVFEYLKNGSGCILSPKDERTEFYYNIVISYQSGFSLEFGKGSGSSRALHLNIGGQRHKIIPYISNILSKCKAGKDKDSLQIEIIKIMTKRILNEDSTMYTIESD